MIIPNHVIPRIIRMVQASEHDTDAASMVTIGPVSDKPPFGAVIVIKGAQNTEWIREALIAKGLLTPGKAIVPEIESQKPQADTHQTA